jgi:hypothetical protein
MNDTATAFLPRITRIARMETKGDCMSKRTEQLEKNFREDWFKDHVAAHIKFSGLPQAAPGITLMRREELVWSKPGSGINRVDYIQRAGRLFVCGDLGEAVYGWRQAASPLKWIAGLDYDYFAGKCEASETGRGFKDWDCDTATRALGALHDGGQFDQQELAKISECLQDYPCDGTPIDSRDEWYSFLRQHADECLGDAWCEWAPQIGEVIHPRCMAHLYGLKMAFGLVPQAVNPSPKT